MEHDGFNCEPIKRLDRNSCRRLASEFERELFITVVEIRGIEGGWNAIVGEGITDGRIVGGVIIGFGMTVGNDTGTDGNSVTVIGGGNENGDIGRFRGG